ncbi:DUF2510 domain-containing protein [Salinibacterium sp. NSLL150]|uniref:phospholipid scramblase-related protein n=1 Tax=unclassified Salinibacterium TaxID=2632331 RepID=UPI0018CF7E3B|nr:MULTISPECIES: phospholipid scramblase-related protein [unclassified Salinibacterium]MBH0099342.1 DUF2510 domain-containing protein [Salinibacterium sp. NSLL35]MBH0102096.1 DUF2510 domain-containing protein [Salinibacterium sp. NSLL150]MBH0104856.1 DUF2510 domain-containing protein [Salinibacterium sp. NSLL16]MBH0107616.1 DUF2510 domain-containing protein [Salinibacterium sp. NSLL17]
MSQQATPGWFPDPFGRYIHRWWDGVLWTEHVGSAEGQSIDAPVISAPALTAPKPAVAVAPMELSAQANKAVQNQIRKHGIETGENGGGGSLFTEQVLVINQRAKLFEQRAEYSIFSQQGVRVGGARQFGMSMSRMVVGQDNATKRLQIVDAAGIPVLTLIRPAAILKSTVTVMREDGMPVGQIVQDNLGVMASLLGGRFNIRFRMESEGEVLGTINAESWRAWDFSIQDTHGAEIARITKTWAGFSKEMFTKADNYVLEMHRKLEDPLVSLVVSAAIAVDTVLNQDGDQRRR